MQRQLREEPYQNLPMDLPLNIPFQWECTLKIFVILIASCTIHLTEAICSSCITYDDYHKELSLPHYSMGNHLSLKYRDFDINHMGQMSYKQRMNEWLFCDCFVFNCMLFITHILGGNIAHYRKLSNFFIGNSA